MRLADYINAYWDERKPWQLAKDPEQRELLHLVCTDCLLSFRVLAIYLAPVLPVTAKRIRDLFNEPDTELKFADVHNRPVSIRPYQHLLTRIDPKQIETMIEASKDTLKATDQTTSATVQPASGKRETVAAEAASTGTAAQTPVVSIDDFAKLDLRIGTVLECAFVDGSDKLLRFRLDAGELGERQIFSGIRAAYGEPDRLVGRHVVFIANLAPRKMRFGVSEGMILSAGSGGAELFLLGVDDGGKPGMPVK